MSTILTRPLLPLITAHGPAIEARFWKYVDKRGADECWEWTGSRRSLGYGQLSIKDYPFKAHRVSFVIANGWEPESVCHTCDNPPCVNPTHLFGGSPADNAADRTSKGRSRNDPVRGEASPNAKLTEALVRDARQKHLQGMGFHALARHFGVARKTITQAVRGEKWSHVQ